MTPILSILVATKNRIPYCKNLIETILNFPDNDFELIIQDNSDSLDLKNFSQSIIDNRFKYNYTPPPFSSIDNFNAVISQASGEYLCLIGDDDSVNPDILKLVRWACDKDIEAIVPIIKSVYLWPDTCQTIEIHKNKNGVLNIYPILGNFDVYSPKAEVKLLMQNGAQNYLGYKLPKLYHGIVKKSKMDEIKSDLGYYVGGLSPDIYIAVCLAFKIDKVYYVDYPLTIPGICTQSTSGEAAVKKTIDKLEDAIHFRDRGKYNWSNVVPKFYCDENIWADSALAALTDLKKEKTLKKFNLYRLTHILLKKYESREDIILENFYCNLKINNIVLKYISKKYLIFQTLSFIPFTNIVYKKIKVKVFGKNNIQINSMEIKNLPNVFQATNSLKEYLNNQNSSIDLLLKKIDEKFGKI